MSSTILHPVVIAQVMINFAQEQGVDQTSCLAGTGITPEMLAEADGLIRREQEMRLLENLLLALPDDPALGFRLGLRFNVSTFGIWGFALRTSRSLREATERALRYLPLSTAYCRIRRQESADQFSLEFDPGSIPGQLRNLLLERDLATSLNLLRELSLAGIHPLRLEFAGAKPDLAEIRQLAGMPVQQHAGRNALVLDRSETERALPMYDAHLVRMLEDQCRTQLQRRSQGGVVGLVRAQLLGQLGLVATLDEVAAALKLSARSLRRKLDEEGSSFRALLEEERRQLASQLLRNSDMTQDELALHLGYADTASFSRAFRRWFDCSPGEFRRQSA